VVDNSRTNTGAIWWEVRPVLIMNESDWPAADGSSGITSPKAMDDAEGAGRAVEVGSNFFLFLSSQFSSTMAHAGEVNPSAETILIGTLAVVGWLNPCIETTCHWHKSAGS